MQEFGLFPDSILQMCIFTGPGTAWGVVPRSLRSYTSRSHTFMYGEAGHHLSPRRTRRTRSGRGSGQTDHDRATPRSQSSRNPGADT